MRKLIIIINKADQMRLSDDQKFEETKKFFCNTLNLPDFMNMNIIKTKALLGLQLKILYSNNKTEK